MTTRNPKRRSVMTSGGHINIQIAKILSFRHAFRQVAALTVFFAPAIGLCDVKVSIGSDDAMQRAFEAGLGEVPSTKPPFLLEITRLGHHVSLTGYDRSGASVARLTCLLCTSLEAESAAAHLGISLGRQYRGAPPKKRDGAAKNATLSVNGVPVTPLPQADAPTDIVAVPQDSTVRFRLGITAAALGASAMVIGGLFLWLDGRCADENCIGLQTLKGGGIGLVVSGAILETGGILLMLLKRNHTVQR